MITVYKYPIVSETDVFSITTHMGAEILTVGLDYERDLAVWVKVDTGKIPETRIFRIIGTGEPLPLGNFKYIGTYMRTLVHHVFEELP